MLLDLTFTERYMLPVVMPQEDSFHNLVIRKDILAKIAIEQEEFDQVGFKVVGNQATWKDPETKKPTEFTTLEIDYIKKKLQALDKAEKLNAHFIDLYQAIT